MNYTENVEKKFDQVKAVYNCRKILETVLTELTSHYCPSSGKCIEIDCAIKLLSDLDNKPKK